MVFGRKIKAAKILWFWTWQKSCRMKLAYVLSQELLQRITDFLSAVCNEVISNLLHWILQKPFEDPYIKRVLEGDYFIEKGPWKHE